MSGRSLLSICLFALAACGDDGGNGTPDAPKQIDAAAATVNTVTCPGTVAATITTLATAFDMPSVTITQNAIVKIVSTPTHPVGPIPGGAMTDPGIVVPENMTRCLQFTAKGTFKFRCTIHNYAGTITVN